MGVAGISGQDVSLQAATRAAQAPDSLSRTVKTLQSGAAPVARSEPSSSEEQVQQATADTVVYDGSRRAGTRLRVDNASRRIITQIVDRNNEIIKQIPPEELLKITATFQEVNGKLFDQKV